MYHSKIGATTLSKMGLFVTLDIINTQHNDLFVRLSMMTLSIMTISIITISIMTISIMTLNILTLSITIWSTAKPSVVPG